MNQTDQENTTRQKLSTLHEKLVILFVSAVMLAIFIKILFL